MIIVSTVKLDERIEQLKEEFSEHTFISRDKLEQLTADDLQQVEVLIANETSLSKEQLEQMPNLKWLMWYVAGVNALPLDYLKERNIILTNARGVHKVQISEFIFAYMMEDYKNLLCYHELQQQKGYKTNIRHAELYGQTIAFLGTGEIPGRTAMIAKAFGMKTIGINTDGRAVEHFDEVYSIDERREAFEAADIIVNVLPETQQTIDLLSREDFEAMGQDALFINVGRGTVVKEELLVEVLKEKVIRKAALDVYYQEPLTTDNPLYELGNVIMTPHITGNSRHYNDRATDIFVRNLRRGLEHKEHFENIVSYDKGY